ncbi:hypothetical protein ABFG93_05935 [Pseudalkalibacillus hwajinpoensis]|uniref:hypothetical protein n=1 Tax=Guptibacillus hwajinpoensis TaxID=208199 RepID=UPI00325AD419
MNLYDNAPMEKGLFDGLRGKHSLQLVFLVSLALSNLFPAPTFATSWEYPFVVWNGYMYEVVDEKVSEVDRKIGQVTRYSDMETYAGNFSNAYEKGTNYWSIQNINTDEAIAVEVSDGVFKKALRRGEYGGGKYDYFSIVTKVIIVVVGGSCVSYFVLKKLKY